MAKDKDLETIVPAELTRALTEVISPIAPPEARSSELKSRVMARIRGKKSFDLMTVRAGEGEWVTLLPGVEKKILSESAEGRIQSYLLRLAAGAKLPPHDHISDEECLMLEGEAMIGDLYLSAGDYHIARKGSKHGMVTTQTGALAFLRAYEPMD